MAGVFLAVQGSLPAQPWPIDKRPVLPITGGKITDHKRGDVLEKMRSLGGRHFDILQSRFDNGAGAGNLLPLHRDAQPGIHRSPASHPHQQVGTFLADQLQIVLIHLLSGFAAFRALKQFRIDPNDIINLIDDSVAQHPVTFADQLTLVDFLYVQPFNLPAQHHRAHLQHRELPRMLLPFGDITGELDLHRHPHPLAPHLQQGCQDLRQGKDLIFQDRGKGHQPLPGPGDAVGDRMILRRICRAHVGEGAVFLGDIKGIGLQQLFVRFQGAPGLGAQVQGIKRLLGIIQGLVDRGELRQVVGIFRAELDSGAPFHHGFAQAHTDGDDTVFGQLRGHRVEVMRFRHPGKIGVKAVFMIDPDHLLDNHRHLFLFQAVSGHIHIIFGAIVER